MERRSNNEDANGLIRPRLIKEAVESYQCGNMEKYERIVNSLYDEELDILEEKIKMKETTEDNDEEQGGNRCKTDLFENYENPDLPVYPIDTLKAFDISEKAMLEGKGMSLAEFDEWLSNRLLKYKKEILEYENKIKEHWNESKKE